jgi:glyoxylase I family protein
MPSISSIHHLAITVSDADASAAFYGELLGLEEAFTIDDESLRARVFGGDGFLFGVRHYKQYDKDRFTEFRVGMDHFAFAVPDRESLDLYEHRLDEMGATYTPAAETPSGAVVVFRDPDGIQGEFFLPA